MEELIDSLNSYGSLLVKLVTAIGVVVVFSYCAFSINFFPKGLSLGDSLVFIFISLGFGVFYLFWLSFGYFFLYGILYPFRVELGKNDDTASKVMMFILGVVFLLLLVLLCIGTSDVTTAIAPLVSGAILLFTTFFWNPTPSNPTDENIKKREKARIGIILFAIFIAPLTGGTAVSKMVDSSFRIFGINQNNVSLLLNEKNYNIVSGVAKELELPLFDCELESGTTRIVHNVRVLWHGIGDKSLIVLLKPGEKGLTPAARLELMSEGTYVLSALNDQVSFNACINFDSDTLFDTYESTPSQQGKNQLREFIKKMNKHLETSSLKIASASIIGYTDRRPVLKESDTNYALSLRRAQSVFYLLTPLFNQDMINEVSVSGKGSLNSKSKCGNELDPLELNECLSEDRRVEVRFQFRPIEN